MQVAKSEPSRSVAERGLISTAAAAVPSATPAARAACMNTALCLRLCTYDNVSLCRLFCFVIAEACLGTRAKLQQLKRSSLYMSVQDTKRKLTRQLANAGTLSVQALQGL